MQNPILGVLVGSFISMDEAFVNFACGDAGFASCGLDKRLLHEPPGFGWCAFALVSRFLLPTIGTGFGVPVV